MNDLPNDNLVPPTWQQAIPRLALRIVVMAGIVFLAHNLINAALGWTESLPHGEQDAAQRWVLVVIFGFYALLIAVPFVPGIEIALALLMLRGADFVWPIYLSTVAGLWLAFLIGQLVPLSALRRVFLDLHLTRACALIDRLAPLSPKQRVAVLQESLPQRFLGPALRFRYLGLWILINMPGSGLIGGGGGISMLAGMSGVFTARATLPTLALAVLPVSFLVWISGSEGLSAWLPG